MSKFNKVKYLVGSGDYETKPFKPYNKLTCAFLAEFSKKLNLQKDINEISDLKALAFWCRKKNIEYLIKKNLSNEIRIGLGLIFHITPSNIATNFIYSLFFGLLTGNSNVVKISSKKTIQSEIICKCLNLILKQKKFVKLKKRIVIIRYENNDNYTKNISYKCNLRVIWGGDETIKKIRKFELNPSSTDITFADRSSICIIDSNSIIKLDSFNLSILVEKFYNDTYLVDQNACSSPHIIFWKGKKNVNRIAQKKFWDKLYALVIRKYNLEESSAIEKYTLLCKKINFLRNNCNFIKYENYIYILKLKKLVKNLDELRGKWGLFFEYETNNLNKISIFLNKKFQTMTYFGLDKNFCKKIVVDNLTDGIDRIVPIGQALDINLNWDGFDLNKSLTRVVEVK
tara:strand:- start:1559 stop:2755 length:1197 start_codon:yes stop_codon:yes gene_type:complete